MKAGGNQRLKTYLEENGITKPVYADRELQKYKNQLNKEPLA